VNIGQSFATGTNWTDVTTPTTANTARVTELWRMDDAHQSTSPLYLYIEYGETGTADSPGIRIKLGTGGSAPVTLTGQFFDTGASYFGPTTVNANSMTHYASGSTSRFAVSFCVTGTSWAIANAAGFGIERRVNASGTEQSTGWLFYRYAAASTRGSIAFKGDGTTPMASAALLSSMNFAAVFSVEANLTFDSKVSVSPLCYCLGPTEIGLNAVVIPATHLGAGATFTVSIFGSSHTFITINEIAGYSVLAGAVASTEMAMRYE
jgi:hypothetical protein